MKAHGEPDAGPPGQFVFAAQVVAIVRQVHFARINQAKALAIAVMAGGDPLVPALFGAIDPHRMRAVAERPVAVQLDRVGIGDDQHRMRRARSHDPLPRRLCAAIAAAIDDDPLAALAHLQRQRPGMGLFVVSGRRRVAGVDDDQAVAGLEALKPAMRRLHRGAALGFRLAEHEVDEHAVLLDRIVEQRKAPVAVAEKPQHRRHPVDRILKRRGHLDPSRSQGRSHIEQVAQYP